MNKIQRDELVRELGKVEGTTPEQAQRLSAAFTAGEEGLWLNPGNIINLFVAVSVPRGPSGS